MLGELTEAEDIVQEAWLRWKKADRDAVRNPESFLVRVTTHLPLTICARLAPGARYTSVPGCPSRCVSDPETPEARAIEAEQLNLALLGALERLNPIERAVLVLRDVFDLEYAEIADVIDRTPANVRQIAKRARDHAGDHGRARTVSEEERERLATAFLAAAVSGDIEQIRDLLAADAVMYSDGGGVVTAARKPIYGADKIARFMVGVQRKAAYPTDAVFTRVLVNGDPGVRMDSAADGFLSIIAIEVSDEAVQCIRFFTNPERFPVGIPEPGRCPRRDSRPSRFRRYVGCVKRKGGPARLPSPGDQPARLSDPGDQPEGEGTESGDLHHHGRQPLRRGGADLLTQLGDRPTDLCA